MRHIQYQGETLPLPLVLAFGQVLGKFHSYHNTNYRTGHALAMVQVQKKVQLCCDFFSWLCGECPFPPTPFPISENSGEILGNLLFLFGTSYYYNEFMHSVVNFFLLI